MDKQNRKERVLDKLDQGLITVDDANVRMVRDDRYRLIQGRVPASVRKALNNAVKQGILGHLKKDGLMPEAYFHPTFKYLAVSAREKQANASVQAILKTCI